MRSDQAGDTRINEAQWFIGLAASAGGVEALQSIVRVLPDNLPAAVVIVLHRPPNHRSHLTQILQRCTPMPVVTARDGEHIVPGVVYVASPGQHLTVRPDRHFHYHDGHRIQYTHSSANPLFESAAQVFDGRCAVVVLTGTGSDATDGVQEVKKCGGIVIAQDEATSAHWSMPQAAIRTGAVDHVLPLENIPLALVAIVNGSAVGPSDAVA